MFSIRVNNGINYYNVERKSLMTREKNDICLANAVEANRTGSFCRKKIQIVLDESLSNENQRASETDGEDF